LSFLDLYYAEDGCERLHGNRAHACFSRKKHIVICNPVERAIKFSDLEYFPPGFKTEVLARGKKGESTATKEDKRGGKNMGLKHLVSICLKRFSYCVLLFLAGFLVILPGYAEADCQNNILTVRVNPAGSGNITSPQFSSNPDFYPSVFTCYEQYTLRAVPQPGYEFVKWSVNYTTTTATPLYISVADGPKTVTAFFQKAQEYQNLPPTADAGDNQSVFEDDRVILDGSGSVDPDDGIKRYGWQQTGGTAVALSDTAAVRPVFTAPEVANDPISLTFRLTVEDYAGALDTDTVTVIVQEEIQVPPTADAGEDQSVSPGSQVTLDASGSFDPNGDGDIVGYYWEQINGKRVTLSDPSAVKPTFTAPEVLNDTLTLEFRLTVEDVVGQKAVASVQIIVTDNPVRSNGGNSGCFVSSVVR
jgi:hypothetical protein